MTNNSKASLWGWLDLSQHDAGETTTTGAALRSGGEAHAGRGSHVGVRSGRARVVQVQGGVAVVTGEPCLPGASRAATDAQIEAALAHPDASNELFTGRFSVVHVDQAGRRLRLFTDRFGVHPLCYAVEGQRLAFSDRADAVPMSSEPALDVQAIFNFIYFHVLPAPRTAFRGVARLEPAHRLVFDGRGVQVAPLWQPAFASSGGRAAPASRDEFRALLKDAVAREIGGGATGAFLSGGTDSSTVAGMLRLASGASPQVFSIGFEAEGYDEIEYARIAARHFDCAHHVYYVTPQDVVAAVPDIGAHYDQPFGNSSALPSYYCGKLAVQHGVAKMLAGDGGDELFGGNVRYAKQKVFAVYDSIPAPLKNGIVEPLALSALARSVPGLKKVASYVAQARVPMPDRTESYNLLMRHGVSNLFTPRFIDAVNADEPAALQRRVYATTAGAALVDRMLAYDWRFTLADNDLPKVVGTADLAHVGVGFPLLDDRLVDFSLRLTPSEKVRRFELRAWFKEALSDFLPVEILRKKKHGFGLPFGPWLVAHPALQALARESINGLVERRLIQPAALDRLFSSDLERFPGYYGEMIWILMMLEQWLRRAAPRWSLG